MGRVRKIGKLAVRGFDRPGGRWFLAAVGTTILRRETGDKRARMFYDDAAWIQQSGDDFLAVGKRFTFKHGSAYEAQFNDCADFWFHVYRPAAGDTIVDVGAGIGSEALVFSRAVGESGRVLAIEAHPDTFGVLERQCRWNNLTNVALCQCAVLDAARPVYVDDRATHEENTVSTQWTPTRRARPIEGASLDDICQRFGVDRVSFLKMNIEGAETLALQGMQQMIERTEAVCIACHDFLAVEDPALRTREHVTAFLKERGFTIVTRDDDPRDYVRDHVHGYRAPVIASKK